MLLFYLKILYFISISLKYKFWQIFKETVENLDIFRKKDDF